jgi:hypothetical protein
MIPEQLLAPYRMTVVEYLKGARDYADPNPGLTREQLLHEMERIKGTLDHVIYLLCGQSR